LPTNLPTTFTNVGKALTNVVEGSAKISLAAACPVTGVPAAGNATNSSGDQSSFPFTKQADPLRALVWVDFTTVLVGKSESVGTTC
jgi:hypothetical protein